MHVPTTKYKTHCFFWSSFTHCASLEPVRQHIIIVDLRGLEVSQILDGGVMRLVARLTHLHDAHYPETLREAVILTSSRASTICQMAISLVKPFLASRTAQKLNVVTESSIRNQGKIMRFRSVVSLLPV